MFLDTGAIVFLSILFASKSPAFLHMDASVHAYVTGSSDAEIILLASSSLLPAYSSGYIDCSAPAYISFFIDGSVHSCVSGYRCNCVPAYITCFKSSAFLHMDASVRV
jgi:hypothetical protein